MLALDIVTEKKLAKDVIMDVHRLYGDHLYDKSDFHSATLEYCQAIGFVESSSIIRKASSIALAFWYMPKNLLVIRKATISRISEIPSRFTLQRICQS